MKIILKILQILAKTCIKRHKPKVIGITGSVGKTSATNFIYQFLSNKFGEEVYMSPYNYNGEFGLPLTILQQRTGYSNPFKWLKVFFNSLFIIFGKKYPKILILEYGIDHIGEMDFLVDIVSPDISVILNLSENHIEQFKTLENIKKEKLKIVTNKSKAIFNIDDTNLLHLNGISYGKSKNSLLRVENIQSGVGVLNFDLVYKEKKYKLRYNLIGDYQIYNILPIFAIGIEFGMEIEEIIGLSKNIYAPAGRGTILKGINDNIIIDGSYNAGYKSIIAGFNYLNNISDSYNKIAFLGDMRELGNKQEEFHKKIAEEIISLDLDYIVLVGELFKKYAFQKLLDNLGEEKIFHFLDSRKAGDKINDIINSSNKKSLIFVKGSQNTIFLEEGIKKFCLEEEKIKLVRQSNHWINVKNNFYKYL